ncbi:MAG: type II toxin-antitoxin system RelE/ParE family toxin [Gammaproteobacteria bacterium]|nr:type II toxin-antitoxin system RelE/ParE family toxin [Gammaproteobacteria bacterium]
MAEYQFSRRAAIDLEAIADYTIEQFGIEQARDYRDHLKVCFQQLADNPRIGRPAEQLSAGLRRFEYRSHIIFYQADGSDILIVRVLHYRFQECNA